jgi:hypothetical protein
MAVSAVDHGGSGGIRRIASLVAMVVFMSACHDENRPALEPESRAAIGRLGGALNGLSEAAAFTGGAGSPEFLETDPHDQVPTGARGPLTRIADARRDLISTIEPGGDSSAEAVLPALEAEIAEARRHIAERAGAVPEGQGRMALPAPAAVVILTDTTAKDLAERLKEFEGRKDDPGVKRFVIRGHLDADLFALACEALLSDPGARARLAPKLTPNDIPDVTPAIADELGIGTTTRRVWQEAIFDEQGRVVLTPSADNRYTLFQAWVEKVNPRLGQFADAFLGRMMSR